jgi:hypothetical protein
MSQALMRPNRSAARVKKSASEAGPIGIRQFPTTRGRRHCVKIPTFALIYWPIHRFKAAENDAPWILLKNLS